MKKGIDYIGVAVVSFVHDGEGRYLLGLRTENCRDEHNRWEPAGGGGVEIGETFLEALYREMKEEIGVCPKNIEYLGHRESFRNEGDARSHWLAFDFKVLVDPSEVKIMEPEMCSEHRWCSLEEFPEPLHSTFPIILEKYKDKL